MQVDFIEETYAMINVDQNCASQLPKVENKINAEKFL